MIRIEINKKMVRGHKVSYGPMALKQELSTDFLT